MTTEHRDNDGLMLGELLLAVSILAIIAVILVAILPLDPKDSWKYREAYSYVRHAERALAKMTSDASVTSPREFFDASAFTAAIKDLGTAEGLNAFEASVQIYSVALPNLMRQGHNALKEHDLFSETLDPNVVARLSTSYLDKSDTDPWGNPYQLFAGPWPEDMGPILFRVFMDDGQKETDSLQPDALTLGPLRGNTVQYGWPAPTDKSIYIWSIGGNKISGQPNYDPTHQYAPPASEHYEQGQNPESMGGGEDINNWDTEQSFMWHYN